jgi:hypothetical protein
MGEGTVARIDAGECMRNLTEARAHELETSAISDIGAYSAGSWTRWLHLPVRLLR